MSTMKVIENLVVDVCGKCDRTYAINELYRSTGRSWACPYYGNRRRAKKTKAEKLEEELKRAEEDRDHYMEGRDRFFGQMLVAERRLAATQGVVTRMKNQRAKEAESK